MQTVHLEIVTPEAQIFSDKIHMVVVPCVEGELGILPHHMPLLTKIKPGVLRIFCNTEEQYWAIGGGFLAVLPERVSIMTDMALREEEIDKKITEEAILEAKKKLENKSLTSEEMNIIQTSLLNLLAQLQLKHRELN